MTTNQVVAYTPHELAAAQGNVRGWCAENIRRLLVERKDAEANLEAAKRAKFRTKPFKEVIARSDRRIEYYKKIGAAIKLGYMIVPNFDMELFAVRTNKHTPRGRATTSSWQGFGQTGETLPVGVGRYVDDVPFEESVTDTVTNSAGKEVKETTRWPTRFDERIEFPVQLVKPSILAATRDAMRQKVFDQIGIVRGSYVGRRADPIVCGRVLDRTRNNKAVTFFIAWWLDKDML
jgi:hypothetical protein